MLLNVLLITVVLICLITDLYNRKIYNAVLFPGLLIALILHFVQGGWSEVGSAVLGFFTGLGILLIPYLLGGMGAGDVKLLALIGAVKGTVFVLNTAVYMALLGAIIAILILLCRKGMMKRFQLFFYFLYGLRYGIKIQLNLNKGTLSATYPYGVAIAGGTIISYMIREWTLI